MNAKHLTGLVILAVILIGSDVFIGFFGHYTASDEQDFWGYLTNPETLADMILILFVAIGVFLFMRWWFGV